MAQLSPKLRDDYKYLKNKRLFDISWGHQKVIISKAQDIEEALFYAHQTLPSKLEQKRSFLKVCVYKFECFVYILSKNLRSNISDSQ